MRVSFTPVLLVVLGLIGTAPFAAAAEAVSQPFAGVRYFRRTQQVPRPLNIHILEIDLTHPKISFQISPGNGAAPGENSARTVRSYITAVGAQIGLNASFFLTSAAGSNLDNRGVVASRGDVYSPFDGDNRPWPVLNLSEDNFAQILSQAVQPSTTTAVSPAVPLYNAVSGSERILTNGRITAGAVTFGEPTTLNPRSVAGITADRKLLLLAVDGRSTGVSEGMFSSEVADLLLQYGAVDAVNLDGGGSTTLVFADPTARVLNRPSDGSERAVGASLAVFADRAAAPRDTLLYADFFRNERGGFTADPAVPGTDAAGLLGTSGSAVAQATSTGRREWSQRLTLRADPAVAATPENPRGWAWRHAWRAAAGGTFNRPATGRVGFWARTEQSGIEVTVAVNVAGTIGRGVNRPLVADGRWHLCEWGFAAPADWTADFAGRLGGATFALDALHFFGGNTDAVIELDDVAHNALGALATEFEPMLDGRLANLSVRAELTPAEPALLLGLTVTAPTRAVQPVLVRAAGPALAGFGLTAVLPDPRLTVLDRLGAPVAANDNWAAAAPVAAAAVRLGAFPFAPASPDAATLTPLAAGNYNVQVTGAAGARGATLAEIYDATEGFSAGGPRLVNLSARLFSDAAAEPVVGGFVVAGGPLRVLVRAVGPGLAPFGVTGVLPNPLLTLYAGGTRYAVNDDWGGGPVLTDQFARVGAFALPATSRDAALLVTLEPGAYTAVVNGAGGTSGAVLLEVYAVP